MAGIHLAVNGRSAWEDESTQGWVDLLHRLLMEGENSDAFDDTMGEIGMEMSVVDDPRVPMDNYRTVPEYSFVRVQAISENWSDAIQFIADRVIDTSFDDSDITEAAQEQLRIANKERSRLSSIASGQFADMLYGDNVRSAPIYGTETSLTDISMADLLEFRKDAFSADNLVLSVLAPAPTAQIIEVIEEAFRELPRSASHLPLQDMPTSTSGVDTVRASGRQGYLTTGFLIPDLPLQRQAAALLANVMVSDRIYRDLGEKKGWAYSAGSSLLIRNGWGAWMSRAKLPEEHLAESLEITYEHLSSIANGDFDEDRLEIARNDMRGSMLRRYSSRINLAMALSTDAVLYDEPNRTWLLYEQLGAVTLEEVKQAAYDLFHQPENIVTVYGLPEGEMEMPKGMPMGGMGGH
ncbi:peptidase M16 inactive domain protein [bacterium BMS3Bbin04]|nr:peptidase M16 inactive domain protein [bacterium BMS3Bbin04]